MSSPDQHELYRWKTGPAIEQPYESFLTWTNAGVCLESAFQSHQAQYSQVELMFGFGGQHEAHAGQRPCCGSLLVTREEWTAVRRAGMVGQLRTMDQVRALLEAMAQDAVAVQAQPDPPTDRHGRPSRDAVGDEADDQAGPTAAPVADWYAERAATYDPTLPGYAQGRPVF